MNEIVNKPTGENELILQELLEAGKRFLYSFPSTFQSKRKLFRVKMEVNANWPIFGLEETFPMYESISSIGALCRMGGVYRWGKTEKV